MTEDVAAVAGRLTEAHREFLLSLPSDGSWRQTSARDFDRHGPNAFQGFERTGLIEGYYQEVMKHRLTDLGIAVRSHLLAKEEGR